MVVYSYPKIGGAMTAVKDKSGDEYRTFVDAYTLMKCQINL